MAGLQSGEGRMMIDSSRLGTLQHRDRQTNTQPATTDKQTDNLLHSNNCPNTLHLGGNTLPTRNTTKQPRQHLPLHRVTERTDFHHTCKHYFDTR